MTRFASTALATILALSLAGAPALAQSDQTVTEPDPETAEGAAAGQQPGADMLVATVGGNDITVGEVEAFVNALPQQMREAPREELVPFAVRQLVMRELILLDAESRGMTGDDDEATETGDASNETAEDGSSDPEPVTPEELASLAERENRMINEWLRTEIGEVATDERVQETYDEIVAQSDQEVPPLDAVRPQIEQQLQQQRLGELREEISTGIEIVFYDADGNPREATADEDDAAGGEDDTDGGDGN